MFTQHDLDLYKTQYPLDQEIQALTLGQVNALAAGTVVDFNSVPSLETYPGKRGVMSECLVSIGWVVFDAVAMALSAIGLRASIKPAAIEAIADAAAPVKNALEVIIDTMKAANATGWDIAKGFFKIISAIWNGGCFGAVLDAFLGALSWWEALTYGIIAVGTIVAILATDGLALIAEIVVLLASTVFLIRDIGIAFDKCGRAVTTLSSPSQAPLTFDPRALGGLRTFTGNFVTVVQQGGLFYGTSPIITSRSEVGNWEKFIVVPQDVKKATFALRTLNGHFLTACNGGGASGPNDAMAPVHTDATRVGDCEKLSLVKQPDESYAIRTPKGFYLTAQNGGGMMPHMGSQVMYTAQRQIGQWELFSFVV